MAWISKFTTTRTDFNCFAEINYCPLLVRKEVGRKLGRLLGQIRSSL